jgi:hypothetical protein
MEACSENEADDFLERHIDDIEHALIEKCLEEAYEKIDWPKMLTDSFMHERVFMHVHNYDLEVGADGTVKVIKYERT